MATQTKKPPLTVSNPWWGHDPSDKQLEALWAYEECPDLFYGGAAGPGKTSYLLMAAVQYVQYPVVVQFETEPLPTCSVRFGLNNPFRAFPSGLETLFL